MALTFKHFVTSSDGSITSGPTDITGIVRGTKVEMTIGDERINQAGDLALNTIEALPWDDTASRQNWVGAYWDGSLIAVYAQDDEYEYDEKTLRFKYRFTSIQSKFFADIKSTILGYSADSSAWNFALALGAHVISDIALNGGSATNRLAFSLGDIFAGLSGRSNSAYYTIYGVSHEIAVFASVPSEDIISIFRGESKPYTDTLGDVIDFTFKEDDDGNPYNMSWWHLFDLVRNAHNAFIVAEPFIASSTLKIQVNIVPRDSVTYSSHVTRDWLERQYNKGQYRVDGYKITGENFEFISDYYAANYGIDRQVAINDYLWPVDDTTLSLCCGLCDDASSTAGSYDVYDLVASVMPGDFSGGYAGGYYSSAVTGGDAFSGEYLYDGEALLDFVETPSEVFSAYLATFDFAVCLLRLVLNEDGRAQAEGFIKSKLKT